MKHQLLAFWFPAICVATMTCAAIVYACLGDWRRAVFWALDAAITAFPAFIFK